MRKSDTRKRSMAMKKSSGHSLLSKQQSNYDNRTGSFTQANPGQRSHENSVNFVNVYDKASRNADGLFSPAKIARDTNNVGLDNNSGDKSESQENLDNNV